MFFDTELLKQRCGFLRSVDLHETLSSTNARAKELGIGGAEEGTLVIAENQTAGRGRLGRTWDTVNGRPGDYLTFSLILRPLLSPEDASLITPVAALAVSDALRSVCNLQTEIKWPNDILHNGRKLCGILTEGHFRDAEYFAVLGIGINLNAEELPVSVADTATGVLLETGRKTPPEELTGGVCNAFFRYYGVLQEQKNLEELKEIYNERCLPGQEIDGRGQLLNSR